MATVAIDKFGLQAGTDSTIYVTWTWDKDNTENYQVKWYYDTGDGIWFLGNDSTTTEKQSIYNGPSNAKKVKVIIKPISKTYEVNGNETTYWTADWSTAKEYSFSDNPPARPDTPTVVIEKYKLTATLDNISDNLHATGIQFQVVKDNTTVFSTGKSTITMNSVSYNCTVDAGGEYKVRCRSYDGNDYSEWSAYSAGARTMPAASSGITTIRATTSSSIYLEWSASSVATSYDLEYTTKKEYFDGSDQVQTISGIEFPHYEKTGLEPGNEYFFRVRAVNSQGASAWSDVKSVVIGRAPAAPTTWSSTTKAVVGEPLTLYWTHNTMDGSRQTYAEIELYINGRKETYTIRDTENDESEDVEDVTHYSIDTSEYDEGTKIQWRVRTSGVTLTYSEWSIQRSIDIYTPATLAFSITDRNGNALDTIETFPFYARGNAGPSTQTPVSFHLTIVSNDVYETTDRIGNTKIVNKGELVYSKHFDISENLVVELSASNVDLENNADYTVKCIVSMDSGLTAESSVDISVAWTDVEFEPDAEISIDKDIYSASIRPFCMNTYGGLIDGLSLSVYRREFDGSFVEIASELDNTQNIFVTDPHPSLDYARYRIVAVSDATGAVSYYDLPPYPVGGDAAIIQWDEAWSRFDTSNADIFEEPVWSGSILKLLYNLDISESTNLDVEHVEYIGREHPVSYHGTQLGESSNWKMVIPADDVETLYAIRRLARWMGNVYVREPSGIGYWATIKVSYNKNHCELTIPITLSITRVEGGV